MPRKSESKQKILSVAEKIFAEKGFDGARVNEIAEEAGVNKALIYYYFDSKEDILDSLFDSLLDQIKDIIKDTISKRIKKTKNLDLNNSENINKIYEFIFTFASEKKDILRIALNESSKTSSSHSVILRMGELIMSTEIEELIEYIESETDFTYSKNVQYQLVGEFFMGIMPLINFIIFADDFSSYYDIEKEDLRKYFIKAFKVSHFSFHEML